MNKRVTQAQIAKAAGVHTTTVSLALRNHPSLPEATRTRLRALADKMGYRPDPALSALISYRTGLHPSSQHNTLAYLTNWDSRLGWKQAHAHAAFHRGALAKADALGYHLEHFWLAEPGYSQERLQGIFQARGIRGLLLASHMPGRTPALRFDWSAFSAVKIDAEPTCAPLHRITNDQRRIMQDILRRLLAKGYRRIGCVMSHGWDLFVDHAWSAGFLTLQQLQVPEACRVPILWFHDSVPSQPPPDFEGASAEVPRAALKRWLDAYRPEVLISFDLFLGKHLEELGLRVPEDLAYVDMFLREPGAGHAGVVHNCEEVGAKAVEILVSQLQQNASGLPTYPLSTAIEGTWHEGPSLPTRASTSEALGVSGS